MKKTSEFISFIPDYYDRTNQKVIHIATYPDVVNAGVDEFQVVINEGEMLSYHFSRENYIEALDNWFQNTFELSVPKASVLRLLKKMKERDDARN